MRSITPQRILRVTLPLHAINAINAISRTINTLTLLNFNFSHACLVTG